MKANEFVKKFGLEASKNIIEGWIYKNFDDSYHISEGIYCNLPFEPTNDCETICLHDLKRLVESHELVERWGGIGRCKFFMKGMKLNKCDSVKCPKTGMIVSRVKMEKAIADVESCQVEGE